MLIPIILSGGSGVRLWPLSRPDYPKQFISFETGDSFFQLAVKRTQGLPDTLPPVMVCNQKHGSIIEQQMKAIGVKQYEMLLEPCPRNTAPAIAASAFHAQCRGEDPLLLVLPSDQLIQDVPAFQKAVRQGCEAAEKGFVVIFGITPTYPATGYGYILAKENLSDAPAFSIDQFVEKPTLEKAKKYLTSKNYYWNAGIFLFKASLYLAELKKYAPDIFKTVQKAYQQGSASQNIFHLDEKIFQLCRAESIDYAVAEKTKQIEMIPLNAEWSDVGSWEAMADIVKKDAHQNTCVGDVMTEQVKNCYIHAGSRKVVCIGIENLVIVETKNAVLVMNKKSSQLIKKLIST